MSSGSTSTKDFFNSQFGEKKRRTSSVSSSNGSPKDTRFQGLMNQKRNSSDAGMAARRASWDEQKPGAGPIGSLWNKFTKGS